MHAFVKACPRKKMKRTQRPEQFTFPRSGRRASCARPRRRTSILSPRATRYILTSSTPADASAHSECDDFNINN